MSGEENKFRKAQRLARDASRRANELYEESETRKALGDKASEASKFVSKTYEASGAQDIVAPAISTLKTSVETGKGIAKKVNEVTGATKKATQALNLTNEHVTQPIKAFSDEKGISGKLNSASEQTKNSYGDIRNLIKPYFAPESAREILNTTNEQLTTIIACVLQVSHKEAAGWIGQFGKVVSAKVAGIAGTATLFGLVSTFGTAGTGTAIANLSGAAAVNATLAAIGGSIATGALVLSGFGLIVGMVTYKFMSSSPRDFEDLPDEDKQIVETCGLLAAATADKLKEDPLELFADDALQFLVSLEELHEHLETNTDKICSNLDEKNSIKYRQHILKDFKPAVLNGFKSYASNAPISPTGIIAGVFYSLMTQTALDGSIEQDLVLDALRRSKNDLNDASEKELSEYLNDLTPEQQRGVANNVKGIYHELMWVEKHNASDTDTYAELHGSTNHQGSDVVIKSKDTNEIQNEYQLKATNSKSYVAEYQEKYNDIEVITTHEVAMEMEGVETSGFSNIEITESVNNVSENVADNTIADRAFESGEFTGLAAAGFEAIKLMNGKTTLPLAGKQTIRTAANAAAATGVTAFLFG